MLVCSVSLRPPGRAIAADLAEVVTAADALATGNVVFATLVDDPASVGEIVDAYLGEIMLEAASAADSVSSPAVSTVDVVEATTAADTSDATIPTMSAEAAAFLARTSGLDTTHTNAYAALIDGLVADGIWPKLDVLYIFATQNSTTAALNLKSSSYTGIVNGSPTFTADRGFTGVDASTTVYIDSQYNGQFGGGNFTQSNAHISAWCNTNAQAPASSGGCIMGTFGNSTPSVIFPKNNSGNYDLSCCGTGVQAANTNSIGHYIAVRSGTTTLTTYKSGVQLTNAASGSGTPANCNIVVLAISVNGAISTGGGYQIPMASIGGNLTSTEAVNFYNRLRTYMTAVGVP